MRGDTKRTELLVVGMRDNAGRERVSEALERVSGVVEVGVSLIRARAVVVHERWCEAVDLVRAVVGAGFEASVKGGSRGDGEGSYPGEGRDDG